LKRLLGTPAWAKDLATGPPEHMLVTYVNDKWSVKEQLCHLVDLDPLNNRPLNEYLNNAEALSATSSATDVADNRNVPVAEI